jgi:hypothetical protein
MSFVVVAIDVTCPDVDLADRLRGTARKFAPHISIIPRIPASTLRSRPGRGWTDILAAVDRLREEPLELCGPVRVTEDLNWYECVSGCRGRPALIDLHHLATARLLEQNGPGPEQSFIGRGYRPHLTTSWRSTGGSPTLPGVLHVRATGLAIYSYQSAPWKGHVRRQLLSA